MLHGAWGAYVLVVFRRALKVPFSYPVYLKICKIYMGPFS